MRYINKTNYTLYNQNNVIQFETVNLDQGENRFNKFPLRTKKINRQEPLHISEYHVRLCFGKTIDLTLIQKDVGVSLLVGRLSLRNIIQYINVEMQ